MNNINYQSNWTKIVPIIVGFYVMGFCDIVGVATSYVKSDFDLSETIAGFIPSMVFIWFFLLSIPSAMIMNRIGRKKMVMISYALTILGLMMPIIKYNYAICLMSFAFLGIGNTMMQVSLNPLLSNVVSGNALTSSLTAGQVIKAISSFCGPIIASFAAKALGDWRFVFPIFAVITIITTILLYTVNIIEQPINNKATLKASFSLLGDKQIRLCFLGILFIVAVDVGVNTVAPKLLMERCSLHIETAAFGSSLYFICRTIGAFVGAIILSKIDDIKYLRINILLALSALLLMAFAEKTLSVLILIGFIGFFCSSVFSIIYSISLRHRTDCANEVSGLMITGVSGGAIVTPLMGFFSDLLHSQFGSLFVIGVCMLLIVICSLGLSRK